MSGRRGVGGGAPEVPSHILVVRDLRATDLSRVAVVHRAAFPESALSRLGPEAVRRYYEWQLAGPHDAVAMGAFENEGLVGFCFGGVFRGAVSGFLQRNRAFLARRLLLRPGAVADPIFRSRLMSGLRILGHVHGAAPPAPRSAGGRPFGILAVATSPSHQGRGVGFELMKTVEAVARSRGFRSMRLTVHPENATAIRFYEGLDWERCDDPGDWRGGMVKTLEP